MVLYVYLFHIHISSDQTLLTDKNLKLTFFIFFIIYVCIK